MFSWSLLWLLKMPSLKVIFKKALVVSDYELKPLFLVLSRRPPLSGGNVELDINTIDFLHINMRLKSSADLTWGNNFFPWGILAFWQGSWATFFSTLLAVLPRAQGRDYPLRSDACNHDQFPASVEGWGTCSAWHHIFYSVSRGCVFLW